MDIYLIRHTRLDTDAGVCYGRLDVPLLPSYEDEFADVLRRLPAVDLIWSSPLSRCRLLAERIAARRQARLIVDPRWVELDFGAWEGKPWNEINRKESDPWASDYWNIAPPNGETVSQLCDRVSEMLDVLKAQAVRRVAVVSHAGPIRAALAQCTARVIQSVEAVTLSYGGVTFLRWDGTAWCVKYVNG